MVDPYRDVLSFQKMSRFWIIDYRLSDYRLSVIGYRLSVIGYWLSVIGYRLLVYKYGVRFVALFRNRHQKTRLFRKHCAFCIFVVLHF